MSLRHLETQIMDQTRSADDKTITAKIKIRFEFLDNGEWVSAMHITEASVQFLRKAPPRRVVRRIETAAWEDVCAYMNGDDTIGDGDNIFSDMGSS